MSYSPHQFEKAIQTQWEQSGGFEPRGEGQPFCIMLPPPNVTGTLHMGHALQVTQIDAMIRYHRMCGDRTLWQPGTDHAGIATQMVVERQLQKQQGGQTRVELGREGFLDKVWQWKNQSGNTIVEQLHRLGASADWSRLAFTMDPHFSEAVQTAFIRLYEEGAIYRGKRLVNWDPVLRTAISDLEVQSEEEPGFLWFIRYPDVEGTGAIIVATTRPETMFGDMAIAVNPRDERYQSLIGKQVRVPLTDRTIPVIGDEAVATDFGTGCLKVTPAHDTNDYAIGQRHGLPILNIFTQDAALNESVPGPYRGLDRFVARTKVVEDLRQVGALDHIEPHILKIPRGDRTKTIIEPWLTDQWFVKAERFVGPAIEAVKEGRIRFVPEHWEKTYLQWLEHAEDWCISRQIWWGHRIPAWYDETGQIYVGRDETTVRREHHLPEFVKLTQDADVLDTWFSSALWPFATLGWPVQTPDLETFYPTSVLVSGFDIIFFWVARMVMFGLQFLKQVPFKTVYLTGLIRDGFGQKMSKSKGNTLDPLDLIDGIDLESLVRKRTEGLMQPEMAKKIEKNTRAEFPNGIQESGTDALRLTICALASHTMTINFSLPRLEGYRNFCNKLWNAGQYVLKQRGAVTESGIQLLKHSAPCHPINRWILSRLQRVIDEVHGHFAEYRFDLLAETLYDFTWHEFCDWYVELTKPVLAGNCPFPKDGHSREGDNSAFSAEPTASAETMATLTEVFETLLRLWHPIMPHLTEALWQKGRPKSVELLMLEPYPRSAPERVDAEAEGDLSWIQQVVLAVRALRGELGIAPGKRLVLWVKHGEPQDRVRVESYGVLIKTLARLETIEWIGSASSTEVGIQSSKPRTALVGSLELTIDAASGVGVEEERERVRKEVERLERDKGVLQAKFANPDFVSKAPSAVVAKDQARLKEIEKQLEKLKGEKECFP